MKRTILVISVLTILSGCSRVNLNQSDASFSDAGEVGECLELPRLATEEALVNDRNLCPTIFSFYQDRLHDDSSSNIQGVGCFEDVGCPDIQVECPYARFGGEDACSQANVRDCALFLRDAQMNGFGLEEIEQHLRCNCRC